MMAAKRRRTGGHPLSNKRRDEVLDMLDEEGELIEDGYFYTGEEPDSCVHLQTVRALLRRGLVELAWTKRKGKMKRCIRRVEDTDGED